MRQNPTQAVDEVESGETHSVTRHNLEAARLVPPESALRVSPEQFSALLRATPLTDDWVAELKDLTSDFDGGDSRFKTP